MNKWKLVLFGGFIANAVTVGLIIAILLKI